MVENFLIGLVFFFLVLVEVSFLPRFWFPNLTSHLAFVFAFLLTFFDAERDKFLPVLFGGFLLDVFSGETFGVKTLNLILIFIFLNFVWSFVRKKSLSWFVVLFLVSFLLWNLTSFVIESAFRKKQNFLEFEVWEMVYNLGFAILGLTLANGFISIKKRIRKV